MTGRVNSADKTGRTRLWLEFIAIYIVLPTLMTTVLPAWSIWPLLSAVTLLAVFLLQRTAGFHWRCLVQGDRWQSSAFSLLFVGLTALVSIVLVVQLLPGQLFSIPRSTPWLWLLILLLYPLFSALPQELVFRVLFVERYGALFPNTAALLVVNATCFGFAHLFYGNWTAPLLSGVGGLVFAWAYIYRASFAYAVVLHGLAGQIIFTSGLGIFFYHGAVGRY